jgi:hypothetical protein
MWGRDCVTLARHSGPLSLVIDQGSESMSKFEAVAHVTDGGAEPMRTATCDGDGLVAGSRLGFIGEVRRVQGKGEVASAEMSGSARCRLDKQSRRAIRPQQPQSNTWWLSRVRASCHPLV